MASQELTRLADGTEPAIYAPSAELHAAAIQASCEDTPLCQECPTYNPVSDACVHDRVHTKCFDGYAREEDIAAEGKKSGSTANSTESGITWKFVGRFGSMNCSLGNRSGKTGLGEKLDKLAEKGKYFYVTWHNGGGAGDNAATKMVCLTCYAKIDVPHPGLPAKNNENDDLDTIAFVDNKVTQFMWTRAYIDKYNLHKKVVCTVERMHPGSVIGRRATNRVDDSDSC